MSGKRMVSSVQITLAPPWRPEITRKMQSHNQEAHYTQSPACDRGGDYQNGDKGIKSFYQSFLDDIPTTEDFIGSDLPPPPPPPPVSRKTHKQIPWDPSPDLVGGAPPPPPVSLKIPKQILRDPSPDLVGGAPTHPPVSLKIPAQILRDPSPDLVGGPLPPPPVSLNTPKQNPQDPSPDLVGGPLPPPPVSLNTPKQILRDPSPDPDSSHLELRRLDLAHTPSVWKPSGELPTQFNPAKSVPAPYTQQRREYPTPDRQNCCTMSEGKQDNGDICGFCHKAIIASVAVIEAMNKQYHASCFTCRKCHRLLAGQMYYQKDGQPICDHCYKDTLEKCAKCQTLITQHIVRAMGNGFHPECFTCVVCNRMIADESFAVDEYDDVHCADDYYRKYAPICNVCDEPIIPRDGEDSYKIECLGKNYHENCYRCEKCHISLSLEPTERGCYPLKGHLLCKPCHLSWSAES
ncbi:filamin-binding LIM protein 1 [Pelodytes ibericus]